MSTITSGTVLGAGLLYDSDTTGNLVIKTGASAVTAATFHGNAATTFNGNVIFSNGSIQTAAAVGYGQTWQNVGASRSTGTTYTNSTGQTIMLAITGLITGTVAFADWLEVGGVVVARVGGVGSTANMPAYAYAIVPAGATYKLNTVTGASFNYWAELR
jgi:hypothetical protein